MIILLSFAFLSGLVTIFAPCIWPLLPIVLSSSATGGHRKSLGITLGVITSFSFFTLSVSYLVMLFHFDPNILRLIAAITIAFLGLTLIIPALLIRYELLITRLSSFFAGNATVQHHGFFGGFVTGLSLGIIWSPCAGPILATIATLAATQSVNIGIILITIAFAIGVGIPLFLFSLAGSLLFQKTRFISAYTEHIQKIFGIIMMLTAFAIYTNYDKVIQAKLLDLFPSYGNFVANFENNAKVKQQLQILKGEKNTTPQIKMPSSSSLSTYGPAPEFVGITNWLNLPAGRQVLSMKDLQGKVVLVDFWTYTCINCIRTLPFVTSWYEKYKDKGFVVVGVHTPEFEFEKKTENVQNAITQYNIRYPVAQDNNYATWNAYNNQYWPAEYLVDVKGNIRRTHFGEGAYDETEKAIQELLKEAGSLVQGSLVKISDQTPKTRISPETYLGSKRMQYLYPSGSTGNGTQTFTLAKDMPVNTFSYGGTWMISDEYAKAAKNASVTYRFFADKVFLVMRPGGSDPKEVKVFLDEKLAGTLTVDQDKLYELVNLNGNPSEHVLRLEFENGVEVFAFTFG